MKTADLAQYRQEQAAAQRGMCPITGWHMSTDVVADHCHKTGMMRATLPRWVNSVLGRLENWAGRVGSGVSAPVFLRKCADYIEFYQLNPSFVFHPDYKTPEERKEATKLRATKKRKLAAAKKAGAAQ